MKNLKLEPTDSATEPILAILGYHKIGEPSQGAWHSWYYVPEAAFVGHLEYLRDAGWQVIDLQTLIRSIDEPQTLPRRAALITFDDGYRSVLEVALPCLLRFGYPAVQFVPTDFIGGWNEFDHGIEPREPICSWDELRQLDLYGVSIQPHGASHQSFSKLSREAQLEELRKPKQIIEEELERPAVMFSFAYGDDGLDPATTETMLHEAGYLAACLYGGLPIHTPICRPYRLPRLAMGPDTDLSAALTNFSIHGQTSH